MWVAELYIFDRDYDFSTKVPDAFVESESQQEALSIIAHYALTMVNKGQEFRIELKEKIRKTNDSGKQG